MSGEHDIEFGVYDPSQEVYRTSRNLPHWFQPGVAIFLTFRAADSMPRQVVQRWQAGLEDWLLRQGHSSLHVAERAMPSAALREYHRLRARVWNRLLDECHGACLLREPKNASIVAESLLHFNGDRYDLDCFVVMPNHVHVLVQFRAGVGMAKQTGSWLRYSSNQINQRSNRKGKFWQSEPFDHLVRSAEQFEYLQQYIQENPTKACLKRGEFLYWCRPK